MADNENSKTGSSLVVAVAIAIVVAIVVTPVVLHFGQKRHNQLHYDVAALYPADQSFAPGEIYANAVVTVMEHELQGTTGWRPNDFILWGPKLWADNNAHRQLGILQALRESVRVFKDHLTKVSSNEFDPNLLAADTAFRNDAFKFLLPSAEGRYKDAVQKLRDYVAGLKTQPMKSRPINLRNVELIRLFQTWGDLLGDAHAILYREQSMWNTDDDFYMAQGTAHAIAPLVAAIGREYEQEFANRPMLPQLVSEVSAALRTAATMKPLIVLDGKPDGIFANHRRNLDAYVSEARQKMYSIREELEK